MPNGYGIYRCAPKPRAGGYADPCEGGKPAAADRRALDALPTPEASNQDVVAAATTAVRTLAALHGATIREPSSAPFPILIVVGGMVLLAVGGAVTLLWLTRRARGVGSRLQIGEGS